MKIHIILNSHLDPVWLWRRSQGKDAVLATARTACDLLDEYPRIHMTRGESWFYETVEQLDPALFRRIRDHVEAGRWHPAGNWYVQSDCNLTPPELLRRQTEWSIRYFRERFRISVKTGYNVDSFGHAATLPDFYADFGMTNYVMMRPGPHEKELPSTLFHWESPSGSRLLTFRIPRSYCTNRMFLEEELTANLDAALATADKAAGHTMLFVGVGDHGGGPVREELAWLFARWNQIPGVEFEFSWPDRFFDEVRNSGAALPVVRDELQHHAVGCYSAVGRIKREMQETTGLLLAAETGIKIWNLPPDPARRNALEQAWKDLFFASFHDLLAGCSIRSAYGEAYELTGGARAVAREMIENAIRQRNAALPPSPCQRMIFDNPGTNFDDYFEFEPWLGPWVPPECRKNEFQLRDDLGDLRDENGEAVPFQRLEPEAASGSLLRCAIRLNIPAGSRRILSFALKQTPFYANADTVTAEIDSVGNSRLKAALREDGGIRLERDGASWTESLSIMAFVDDSDTWSHGMTGYRTDGTACFRAASPWRVREGGLRVAESVADLTAPDGKMRLRVRRYSGTDCVEVALRLTWFGGRQVVKLCLRPAFPVMFRRDGIMGGSIPRALDGKEYPFRSWSMLSGGDGRTVAVISRELTSLDVQPDGLLRLTLLRSPFYAHHAPYQAPENHDYPLTEQGEQEYLLRFLLLDEPDAGKAEAAAEALKCRIFFSESTFGVGVHPSV